MKFINTFSAFIFILLLKSASAQDYPLDIYHYNFIHYDKNIIHIPGDSSDFNHFFSKLDTLIRKGKGKINIIHIGGSHIQAGIYSGRTRQRLQTFYPGLNGGRGMIFPYRMARTNSPNNYNITWKGKWATARNVEYKKHYDLGLLGIRAKTIDSTASIKVELGKKYLKYDFNKIRVFHEFDNNYSVIIDKYQGESTITEFPEKGFTQIDLDSYIDTLHLRLRKTDSLQNKFVLYGINLENDNPGIVYHDVGINGASFPSFKRNNLFTEQMSQIKPDLVIISVGTNDAYTRNFAPQIYKQNYIDMILKIKKASPNAAILMTVPNDSYYRRRYPNKNTAKQEKVILEAAKEYNCGVWDFFEIMGGYNSSILWYKKHLMIYDKIHFSASGYMIKGDLLFNAILKAYDKHIENSKEM